MRNGRFSWEKLNPGAGIRWFLMSGGMCLFGNAPPILLFALSLDFVKTQPLNKIVGLLQLAGDREIVEVFRAQTIFFLEFLEIILKIVEGC